MSFRNSEATFFDKTDTATLSNCDREPIHLSGKILSLGALLIVDPERSEIVVASENAAAFLGVADELLLGTPLYRISKNLAEQVKTVPNEVKILHQILEFDLPDAEMAFDCIAHGHGEK